MPHLITVQFSKILPLRHTESAKLSWVPFSRYIHLSLRIYFTITLLNSYVCIWEKKVQLLTSALVIPSSHKLTWLLRLNFNVNRKNTTGGTLKSTHIKSFRIFWIKKRFGASNMTTLFFQGYRLVRRIRFRVGRGSLYLYVSWKDNILWHIFNSQVENTASALFFPTIGKILVLTFENLHIFISLKSW